MARRIACFAMSDANHFNGLVPMVRALAAEGVAVRVWTDAAFAGRVAAAGAEFSDLFVARALADIDDTSLPIASRFVTFAADRGEALAAEVAEWGAELVVFSSFAYVGRVVAHQLALPYVTLLSGHAVHAPSFRTGLVHDARVRLDPRCEAAAAVLRDRFGMSDASPFSYVADASPWLNIYKEPQQWLSSAEATLFEPLACFGSLAADVRFRDPLARAGRPVRRIYASFGTIIWRYYADAAAAALLSIAEAAEKRGLELVVGLGGAELGAETRTHLAANATVHAYADQWAELDASDVFISHNGLGSTHEAVAAGVPMIAYPFFWDQPGLAARCAELGLAVPLKPGAPPQTPVTSSDVLAALDVVADRRENMLDRLAEAQDWERQAIADRPAISQRIIALA